jgi:hypothetical protein
MITTEISPPFLVSRNGIMWFENVTAIKSSDAITLEPGEIN